MRRRTRALLGFALSLSLACTLFFFRGTGPFAEPVWAAEEITSAEPVTIADSEIYAQSAVLMDAASGRVLYQKAGEEFRSNASTTKILTCILALENCSQEELVAVSEYAASMPDVQLNMSAGEYYRLGDLLYSLMLESHNDTAVAIAEHVAGSVENFAAMMNEKATQIGCSDSFFVTPNGLDATAAYTAPDGSVQERGHGTTARDLALIMSYCVLQSPQKEAFLEITRTPSYSFCNKVPAEGNTGEYTDGGRTFSCTNHNAYLQMDGDALSGKTGFTSAAGYCYVGAVQSEGRTFAVALLACGWPNNRDYKWRDCSTLFTYAKNYYHYRSLEALPVIFRQVEVTRAANDAFSLEERTSVTPEADLSMDLLVADWEQIHVTLRYPGSVDAPLEERTVIGNAQVAIGTSPYASREIVLEGKIPARDLAWYFCAVLKKWMI